MYRAQAVTDVIKMENKKDKRILDFISFLPNKKTFSLLDIDKFVIKTGKNKENVSQNIDNILYNI